MAPPIPTLVITPNETRDRNGPVPLNESGAVRRVPFDGGQAFFVEEGTTNLVRNPSATSSWSGAAANQTMTVVNDDPHEGATCLRIESSGTDAGFLAGAVGEDIVDGTTYTASVYVKVPDQRQVNIALHCSYADDVAYFANSETFSLEPNVWTRLQVTGVVPDPRGTITQARARVVTSNDTGGTFVWYADSAQFEAKPYATTFAHGDMGDGYSWTGTPHDSASVREDTRIHATYPMPLDEGSFYIRWQAEDTPTIDQSIGGLGMIGGTDEVVLSAYINSSGNQAVRTRPTYHHHGPLPLTEKGHRNVYVEYTKETTASDFREGGGRVERGRAFPDAPWTSNRVAVGYSGLFGVQAPLNGYVAALIAYDRPLTPAEIARLDAIPTAELSWANFMPKIGGVRTVHDPAPFAVRSIHEEI